MSVICFNQLSGWFFIAPAAFRKPDHVLLALFRMDFPAGIAGVRGDKGIVLPVFADGPVLLIATFPLLFFVH